MTSDERPVTPERLPKIKGFEVLRRIGTGGYSAVYEAIQEDVSAPVALKVLEVAYDQRARTRFERECQSMGRLRGERGIVSVYSATYTEDGRPVIVMALLSGGSLAERLTASGPLSVQEMLAVATDICSALTSAHNAGIYHRDIKPENILLDRFGRAALTDFGIATMAGEVNSTETVSSLTPAHAPPERYLSDQHSGDPVRGDIYSLASTLHTVLTGRAPHGSAKEGGIAALIQRILKEPPAPLLRADVPDRVRLALARAMAKDPDERFVSGEEFLAAFEEAPLVDSDRGIANNSNSVLSKIQAPVVIDAVAPTDDELEDLEKTRRRPSFAQPPSARVGPDSAQRLKVDANDASADDAEDSADRFLPPRDKNIERHRSRSRRIVTATLIMVTIGATAIFAWFRVVPAGSSCLPGPGSDQDRGPHSGPVLQGYPQGMAAQRYYWPLGDKKNDPVLPISRDTALQFSISPEELIKLDNGWRAAKPGTLLQVAGAHRVWRINEYKNKEVIENACSDDVYQLPNVPGILDRIPLQTNPSG